MTRELSKADAMALADRCATDVAAVMEAYLHADTEFADGFVRSIGRMYQVARRQVKKVVYANSTQNWTGEDVSTLFEMYTKGEQDDAISKRLKRSPPAIRLKRSQMLERTAMTCNLTNTDLAAIYNKTSNGILAAKLPMHVADRTQK